MSQSANTKHKITQSAISVFAQNGYWKTKISDIVGEANVSQGTFYNYFSSKEDCFGEIVQNIHDDVMGQLNRFVNNNSAVMLTDVCKIITDRFEEIRDVAKIFLFEALGSNRNFQKMVLNFKKDVRVLLKEVICRNQQESSDSYRFLSTRISLISAMIKEILEVDIIINMNSRKDIHKRIDEAVYIVFGGSV